MELEHQVLNNKHTSGSQSERSLTSLAYPDVKSRRFWKAKLERTLFELKSPDQSLEYLNQNTSNSWPHTKHWTSGCSTRWESAAGCFTGGFQTSSSVSNVCFGSTTTSASLIAFWNQIWCFRRTSLNDNGRWGLKLGQGWFRTSKTKRTSSSSTKLFTPQHR